MLLFFPFANVTFFTLKKLLKIEIFRLYLNNSSNIKNNFPLKYKKNWPKYARKMYFILGFYLFSPGDVVTRTGERDIWSVSLKSKSRACFKILLKESLISNY